MDPVVFIEAVRRASGTIYNNRKAEGGLQRYDLSKTFYIHTKLAGLSKKVSPHILRHTFATILIKNNCNLFAVQQLLGQTDVKTTVKYYLGVDKGATKAAHDKFLRL